MTLLHTEHDGSSQHMAITLIHLDSKLTAKPVSHTTYKIGWEYYFFRKKNLSITVRIFRKSWIGLEQTVTFIERWIHGLILSMVSVISLITLRITLHPQINSQMFSSTCGYWRTPYWMCIISILQTGSVQMKWTSLLNVQAINNEETGAFGSNWKKSCIKYGQFGYTGSWGSRKYESPLINVCNTRETSHEISTVVIKEWWEPVIIELPNMFETSRR